MSAAFDVNLLSFELTGLLFLVLGFAVLRMEPQCLHTLAKCSSTELHGPQMFYIFLPVPVAPSF